MFLELIVKILLALKNFMLNHWFLSAVIVIVLLILVFSFFAEDERFKRMLRKKERNVIRFVNDKSNRINRTYRKLLKSFNEKHISEIHDTTKIIHSKLADFINELKKYHSARYKPYLGSFREKTTNDKFIFDLIDQIEDKARQLQNQVNTRRDELLRDIYDKHNRSEYFENILASEWSDSEKKRWAAKRLIEIQPNDIKAMAIVFKSGYEIDTAYSRLLQMKAEQELKEIFMATNLGEATKKYAARGLISLRTSDKEVLKMILISSSAFELEIDAARKMLIALNATDDLIYVLNSKANDTIKQQVVNDLVTLYSDNLEVMKAVFLSGLDYDKTSDALIRLGAQDFFFNVLNDSNHAYDIRLNAYYVMERANLDNSDAKRVFIDVVENALIGNLDRTCGLLLKYEGGLKKQILQALESRKQRLVKYRGEITFSSSKREVDYSVYSTNMQDQIESLGGFDSDNDDSADEMYSKYSEEISLIDKTVEELAS